MLAVARNGVGVQNRGPCWSKSTVEYSGAQAVLREIPASVRAHIENQMSLLWLSAVGSFGFQAGLARRLGFRAKLLGLHCWLWEPSAEDILAVVGELAAGSETRMNAYSAMFQQKATCDYQERLHASLVDLWAWNFVLTRARAYVSGSSWASPNWFGSFAANHRPCCVHIGFGSSPPARRYWHNEEEGLGHFGPWQHCCAEALQRWRSLSNLILFHVRTAVRWSWREPFPGESCLGLEWIFLSQKTCSSPPNAYARKDLLCAPCVKQLFCDVRAPLLKKKTLPSRFFFSAWTHSFWRSPQEVAFSPKKMIF